MLSEGKESMMDHQPLGENDVPDRELEKLKNENENLELSLSYASRLFAEERHAKEAASKEANKIARIALRYQKEYRKLLGSRTVKIWLGMRGLLGKPYKRYNEQIPLRFINSEPDVNPINHQFIERSAELTKRIPDSNGSAYYSKAKMKIGIITDEFMFNYYKDAVELVYLSPENYQEIIDSGEMQCLLYVSAWRGLGYREGCSEPEFADYYGSQGFERVLDIVDYAKSKSVPVLFQTIEDPPDYDRFLCIAKKADYIFTSAEEKVADYIADTGNERVFPIEYGINPAIHNPIGFLLKHAWDEECLKGGVFFAGSWYPLFKKRCDDTKMIFDGIRATMGARLYLADRNFYMPYRKRHEFPSEFSDCLVPSFRHDELQKVHKLFDATVNVNSVTGSKTMCAMRVYEVQALGGIVLSNYALSVSRLFPGVFTIHDRREVSDILRNYTRREIINMQIEGIRRVFSACTVFDRLNYIFACSNVDFAFAAKPVFIIVPEGSTLNEEALSRQTMRNYRVIREADALSALSGEDGFAIVWDADTTNRDYLLDMVNAFKFVDTAYVNYVSESDWRNGYSYSHGLAESRNTLFNLCAVDISKVIRGDTQYLSQLDGFSILAEKWGRDTSGAEKELAVIIPIHNNGNYLKDRSFRSLLRSSIFEKMHIYLIDDGSTDEVTPFIVEELARDYDNVTSFYFNDGGSGSASRPRNKGLELCEEPYVTYLDPDNEAINDGYAYLLDKVKNEDADFSFGSVTFVKGDGECPGTLRFWNKEEMIDDPREALIEKRFAAQSMQACVIKRDFLVDNNLKCVEGAIGEDTLFFYELVVAADSMYSVTLPIHVYYADRDGSSVNDVGVSFFKRSLLCEQAQVAFLKREGLLDAYKASALNRFMNGWYKDKLMHARNEELEACGAVIQDIWKLYQDCGDSGAN